MFQDWVICIFSYNRGAFLKNLLESIRQFYPEMSIAIFDDGSTEPEALEVLREESSKAYIHTNNADRKQMHGGLYANMNAAIQYACTSKFRYAYFVQDDMQFMWRDEELPMLVSKIFEQKDCIMCNFNFLARLFRRRLELRMPHLHDNIYTVQDRGIMDTGIYDVGKLRLLDFSLPYRSEKENGRYFYDQGYRMIWSARSHLAWLPWPTVYSHGKVQKRKLHKLEPLTKGAKEKIKRTKDYTFLEDYTSAKSLLLKPYWYTTSPGNLVLLKVYIKYYLGIPM
jgi:glycosyltransferase involved in cell wall biosynthesis